MPHSLSAVLNAPAGQVRHGLPAGGEPPRPEEGPLVPADVEDQGQLMVAQPLALDLDKAPTPGVARLNVMDDGSDCFTAKGYGPHVGQLGSIGEEARKVPRISLADVAREGRHKPNEVITLMRLWSRGNPLSQWCAELLEAGVQSIVVHDVSKYEIPWEMLVIAMPSTGSKRYLGAAMAVSRESCGEATAETTATAPRAIGAPPRPVLTYISAEMAGAETGAGSLESLSVDTTRTLQEFMKSLVASAANYGLVYIACHGTHSDSVFDVYLGSLSSGDSHLRLSELVDVLEDNKVHAPVFINACHSARLFEDREIYTVMGFAAEFVERGAPGVVGTTGEVSSTYAASFARDFLRDAAEHPDMSMPELLRRQRERVVKRHAQGDLESGELVNAFKYVYYGQPNCTVGIERAT